MKRVLLFIVVLLVCMTTAFAGGQKEAPAKAAEAVKLALWTQEGESEGAFQFVVSLAEAFQAAHANVTIEVLNKETEALREDFQTASLAGDPPAFVWTVNDHAGPFTTANLIMPVESLADLSKYVEGALGAVTINGKVWGVPISSGNHLMLLYNKDLIATPPATTDDLIKVGKQLTKGDTYGIVWNQMEPFWLVPWLGGFGGQVFDKDGVTPTLNTKAMVDTLRFLQELKFTQKIMPAESDYGTADTLFKEGKAAMLINGDWSLGDYKNTMGARLGVARIPKISSTGKWPAPYTSGKYFMVSNKVTGAKLDAVKEFIAFATNQANQLAMVEKLTRLPALKTALDTDRIKNDPILKSSSDQMVVGTGMPPVIEMRCNWDAMKPELIAALSKTKTPEDAAAAMQKAAEACVKTIK
ncbi:MAG: extracellular solute-binding protein [Candidatus Omnitrophota bacterium]